MLPLRAVYPVGTGAAGRFTSAALKVLGLGPFTSLVLTEGAKELLLVTSIDSYQIKY